MTNTYHIDNNSSNIQISVTGSSQYGWIEGSNSTFNFNIRNGILVKIGIESNLDETNSFKVNSVRKDGKDKIVQLHENSVLEIVGQLRLHYISYDAWEAINKLLIIYKTEMQLLNRSILQTSNLKTVFVCVVYFNLINKNLSRDYNIKAEA